MKEDAKDIIFTDDLVIENGDFKVSLSDGQHIEHILKADRGQWRQWPLLGFGLQKYLKGSPNRQELAQLVKLHLRADNFNVRLVKISPGDEMTLDVDAKRIK